MKYNSYSTEASVTSTRPEDDRMIFYLAFRGRGKRGLLVKVIAKDEETVKQLVSKIEEKGLHPHLVHPRPAPPSSEKVRGRWWCPYCREWRKFAVNQARYTTCEVCGVSDMDYYTRKYNHLWGRNSRSGRLKKK